MQPRLGLEPNTSQVNVTFLLVLNHLGCRIEMVGRVGIEPTMFTTEGAVLQTAATQPTVASCLLRHLIYSLYFNIPNQVKPRYCPHPQSILHGIEGSHSCSNDLLRYVSWHTTLGIVLSKRWCPGRIQTYNRSTYMEPSPLIVQGQKMVGPDRIELSPPALQAGVRTSYTRDPLYS